MEVVGNGGSRVRRRVMNRGLSPEIPVKSVAAVSDCKTKAVASPPAMSRTIQIVYYLSRNGQLEHPHFMEISCLPKQHLRLKDVIDRLTTLRGKGMPSLFSWSCKRSYKNGYVWNDLTENDVIHPADGGAEYVLKGSEIIRWISERFQHPPVSLRPPRTFPAGNQIEFEEQDREDSEDIEDEEDEIVGKSGKLAGVQTAHHRCSGGVSPEEEQKIIQRKHIELSMEDSSPPSSSSSDKQLASTSQRFEDGDPVKNLTRNSSVLMQLISCSGGATTPARNNNSNNGVGKKSEGGGGGGGLLHRGVLSRFANRKGIAGDCEEFKFVKEDKEYFSGSIIECITGSSRHVVDGDEEQQQQQQQQQQGKLKRSNSYNEERVSTNNRIGIDEEGVEGEKIELGEENGQKGRCIPGTSSSKKSNFKQQQQQQQKLQKQKLHQKQNKK